MSEEYKIGNEYEVEGQKAIYAGETDKRKFFLSVDREGAITEHTIDLEGKVERYSCKKDEECYNMLMHQLEDLYK